MTYQLLAARVLVNDAPYTDAVVRSNLHALVDGFLALLVVVEVLHHVKQTVNEYSRRTVLVDSLQRHAPAVGARCNLCALCVYCLRDLAQHNDVEVVSLLVDRSATKRHYAVLNGDGVGFLHLCVDIQNGARHVWVKFASQFSIFTAKYRGHKLRQRHGLTVTSLTGDGVNASERCKWYTVP